MKTQAEFDSFYYENIHPKLIEMEAVRRKYVIYFFIALFCCLIFAPMTAIMALEASAADSETPWLQIIILIVCVVVSSPFILYRRHGKNNIMSDFISFFGNFNYRFQEPMNDCILQKSALHSIPTLFPPAKHLDGV